MLSNIFRQPALSWTGMQARKQASHARIVEAASRLLRLRGEGGVSVDTVMAEAGLTRGGFYAHFRDKGALVGEALRAAFDEAAHNLRLDDELEGEAFLERALRVYLSRGHLEHSEAGCAVPSLAGEVARAEPEVRATFTAGLRGMIDGVARRLGGPKARARATVLLVSMIGAVAVARAVDDPELGDEILSTMRSALRKAVR